MSINSLFYKSLKAQTRDQIVHIVKKHNLVNLQWRENSIQEMNEIEHIFIIYKNSNTKSNIDIWNLSQIWIKEISINDKK